MILTEKVIKTVLIVILSMYKTFIIESNCQNVDCNLIETSVVFTVEDCPIFKEEIKNYLVDSSDFSMIFIDIYSGKPDKSYLLRLTCKKRIWTAYKKSYEKTLTAIENESLTSKSIDSLVINLNTGSFLQTCSDNSTQNNTYYLFIKKSGVFIFQYLAAPYDFNYLKLDDYRKISKTVELVKFLQSELSSLPVR